MVWMWGWLHFYRLCYILTTNCVNSIFKILKVSKLDSPCTLYASCIIIDCKPGNYTSPKNNNNILLPWTLPKHGEIVEAKTIWCSEVTPRPTKGLPDGSTKFLRSLLPLEGMQVLTTAVVHQYPWFIPLVLGEWDERKRSVLSSERMLIPGHVSTRGLHISWPQAIESFLLLSCCYLLCSFRGPPPENHFYGGGLLLKDASYLLFRTQFRWQLFGYKTNSAIYKPRFSAPRW